MIDVSAPKNEEPECEDDDGEGETGDSDDAHQFPKLVQVFAAALAGRVTNPRHLNLGFTRMLFVCSRMRER